VALNLKKKRPIRGVATAVFFNNVQGAMGIEFVASLAARVKVGPNATMRSTFKRNSSAARSGKEHGA
jgi:hypothetical protein